MQFYRQVPMLEYIVDFYCHELMFAIEVDGNSHDNKYEYDADRQAKLEQQGIKFLRLGDLELKKEMFSVLLKIEETIYQLKNVRN